MCIRDRSSVLAELKEMDIPLKIEDDSVTVKSEKRPRAPKLIRTAYYPGFPTDAQALMKMCIRDSAGAETGGAHPL